MLLSTKITQSEICIIQWLVPVLEFDWLKCTDAFYAPATWKNPSRTTDLAMRKCIISTNANQTTPLFRSDPRCSVELCSDLDALFSVVYFSHFHPSLIGYIVSLISFSRSHTRIMLIKRPRQQQSYQVLNAYTFFFLNALLSTNIMY